jgi:hypothetical protein
VNTIFISILGFLLCTGPIWGAAIGYTICQRGWRLRSPFHQGAEDEV